MPRRGDARTVRKAARLRAAVLEAGIALRPFEGRDTP